MALEWMYRTQEEKQQIRTLILELLKDGRKRTYKQIDEELAIPHASFELDALYRLEKVDYCFIDGYRHYSIKKWGFSSSKILTIVE